nr:hypothetical protein Iba_chr05fCG13360 [Ipomoea batatas]
MPVLFTSNFHYHYRMPTHEYEPMGGMPNGGIGPIPIPIPPMGGGGAKLPPAPGPPIPGIGGAGKARGSSCAYIFCNSHESFNSGRDLFRALAFRQSSRNNLSIVDMNILASFTHKMLQELSEQTKPVPEIHKKKRCGQKANKDQGIHHPAAVQQLKEHFLD